MFVTQHTGVWDRALLDRLWTLYEVAYEPMAEAAVTHELLAAYGVRRGAPRLVVPDLAALGW